MFGCAKMQVQKVKYINDKLLEYLCKCDTWKLSKFYWYREKFIDITRKFDTIKTISIQ